MTDHASPPPSARGDERRFFGRRKGHRLRRHQAALIDTLLPRLALDLTQPAPAGLSSLFPPGTTGVRLEIGFGGGEHLIAQAAAQPALGFIGCEPFVNGMAKVLAAIEADGRSNIRLFAGDAMALLAWLPPASLDLSLIHI